MNATPDPLIDALRQALAAAPANPPLWEHLADRLIETGRRPEAIEPLRQAITHGGPAPSPSRKLVTLLREENQLAEALIRAESALEAHDDPLLRLELARVLQARGDEVEARKQYHLAVERDASLRTDEFESTSIQEDEEAESADEEGETSTPKERVAVNSDDDKVDIDRIVEQFEADNERITFADVVGLEDVKKQINLRIIAPLKNKAIFEAFRKKGGGGGILLYGPPGCGKTFVARATAGEIGARFVSVGIHDILDKWWGESEKAMHALFDDARRRAPTILFFDEFDAFGSSRGRTNSHHWTVLIDVLLAEMDGIAGRNRDVLVFAATNVPWNVDSAFRRPGRFDRMLFVPPPDEQARGEILRRHLADIPGGAEIAIEPIAKQTHLFSGADLRSLAERASETSLSRSLESGEIHPVTAKDLASEMSRMRSSAMEWLGTAKNYVRYANEHGIYDELGDYLRKVKMA